jgi:capsular polysaccharide transport system permease protein
MKIVKKFTQRINYSFLLLVVLPTAIASSYFGLMASDRYVSVSEFVVRSPQKPPSVTGLTALLQGGGFSRSQDDAYVVHQYMLSRDVVVALEKTINIQKKYDNNNLDFLSRFNPTGMYGGLENFFEYYNGKVKIELDSASSISSLTTKAYSAEDTYEINNKLLEMAESFVNKLNERGRQDLVNTAEKQVVDARLHLSKIMQELSSYRRENQIFDIDKQAAMQMQLVSKLQDQLILVKTQLAQVKSVTPENPQIKILDERKNSIQAEITSATQVMLGSRSGSINNKAAEYEKLNIEKEFAIKQLTAATTSYEQNKNDATRKQLYLERIAQPRIPDVSTEPKRLKNILTTLLVALITWGIYTLLLASVKEHGN